jgi:hypothetical protein
LEIALSFSQENETFPRERLEIVVIDLAAATSFQRELFAESQNHLLLVGNQRKARRTV